MTARRPSLTELAFRARRQGRNAAEALRTALGSETNTVEIIEAAYEAQAGSYIESAAAHWDDIRLYAGQLARHINPGLHRGDTILDAGAGEMTTLAALLPLLEPEPAAVFACDISETRLRYGGEFLRRRAPGLAARIRPLRCSMDAIPLPAKSVDVVISNHGVEPNGGRETDVLRELIRVARRKLILFEPCFEIASPAARARMISHCYVRGLQQAAERLGARVEVVAMPIVANPLNPTACFTITPG